MIRKTENNQGFTLIEVIIYVAIIGLVIGSFISFSVAIANVRNKTYVVQEVQSNGRLALDLITKKIMAANGVNIGSSVFDTDPGSLSLSMADSGVNPTIISLSADDGVLQIQEGLSSPVAVTGDNVKVTNLVFTDLTGDSNRENIKVEMTISFNVGSSDVEYNFSQDLETSVSLRQ